MLALILAATFSMGELIFGEYCPWRAAWSLGGDEVAIGGAIVLGLVVAGGLLAERAWCRYACPREEALTTRAGRRPISAWLYGALAAAIFGGVILLSQATGLVSTDEIKGWRTLQEITDIWGMPQDLLYRELGRWRLGELK